MGGPGCDLRPPGGPDGVCAINPLPASRRLGHRTTSSVHEIDITSRAEVEQDCVSTVVTGQRDQLGPDLKHGLPPPGCARRDTEMADLLSARCYQRDIGQTVDL